MKLLVEFKNDKTGKILFSANITDSTIEKAVEKLSIEYNGKNCENCITNATVNGVKNVFIDFTEIN